MERPVSTKSVRAEPVEAGALSCAGLRQAQAERSGVTQAERSGVTQAERSAVVRVFAQINA